MANYAHDPTDLTVEMTADDAPSPCVASASSVRDVTWQAWKAFNHAAALNSDNWTAGGGQTTGWLKFDFGAGNAKSLNGYTVSVVTSGGYTNCPPKNWTLEGSNNDADWTTLDTQTNQTTWTEFEMRTFSFAATTAYRYFRLNISANNGDGNWLIVGELELLPAPTATEINASIVISPQFSGTVQAYPVISASIIISPQLSGYLIKGVSGDINTSIVIEPLFSGTIEKALTPELSASIVISPQMSGVLQIGDVATGSLTLPMLTLSAVGLLGIDGAAHPIIPMLILTAEGYDECLGIGYPIIPALEMTGVGNINEFGEASLSIPKLSLNGEIVINEVGEASLTLPILMLSMSAVVGFVGTGAVTIPMLKLSATGILSAEGTANLTLPMLTLFAEIATASANYQNMVMNLKNNALSIYSNYPFNSFCRFNGVHLGATSTKIYNLGTGTTDEGTAISWAFKTAFLDMEAKTKKKLRVAWLTLKTDGNLILTVSYPDGTAYEYTAMSYETTEDGIRVKFGKGLASRYLALEVSNVDGSTLTLDSIRLQLDQFLRERDTTRFQNVR